jgi:hypothetical protein
MTPEGAFRVMTQKQLLDEQISYEEGRFKLGWLSPSAVDRLIERAFTRMKSMGWEFRTVAVKGFIIQRTTYVFEFIDRNGEEANR